MTSRAACLAALALCVVVWIAWILGQRWGVGQNYRRPVTGNSAAVSVRAGLREGGADEESRVREAIKKLETSAEAKEMQRLEADGRPPKEEDMRKFTEYADRLGELRGKLVPEPRLFYSTNYPPTTVAEQEMWTWFRAMRRIDSRFVFKRPVEFFGVVRDENGKPVAGADVGVEIQKADGWKKLRAKTDRLGHFRVGNEEGKMVYVGVTKAGYGRSSSSQGWFEYAEFYSDRFHIPDKANPVVFTLPRFEPRK